MKYFSKASRCTLLAAVALCPITAFAQLPNRPPSPDRTDEIIRIKTELVQTEVMVFDRQGRFVDGLKPEQFELKLNGSNQPISFFERVISGSSKEAAQLAAARGPSAKGSEPNTNARAAASERGRMLFFFLDDAHLSPSSLARARETLSHFVDDQMNPADQVAIVSTSGQIGFLQQLTDNPAVLRAAIARLNYKMNPEAYTGKTQISEYMATQVLDYGNRELYAYLLESIKVEQNSGPGSRHGDHRLAASYSAAPYLKNRLHQINNQGRMTTADTLDVLRSLIDSSSALPGRKVVFFLSDGFIVNERKAGALEALQRVTSAAARSGVVIYTMDLRGTILNLGSSVDASSNAYADLSGRRMGLAMGEITATQEPLKIIADETGGRAILNSNSISDAVAQAIGETSEYYLLAWRPGSPDFQADSRGKMRVRVTVKDRPELRVHLRANFYFAPVTAAKTSNDAPNKVVPALAPDAQLVGALASLYPDKTLPVSLALGFQRTTEGSPALKVSMQIDRRALTNTTAQKPAKAEVDVLGVALDDRGQFASFKQVLTVSPKSGTEEDPVKWHQELHLKPGLYQVRLVVRERGTGRTGGAQQWIEIPDESQRRLNMSSLFLAERKETFADPGSAKSIAVDVDHRFARSSVLRFQTYVYDAVRGEHGPDVWVQTQVLRNRQQVMSVAPTRVPVTTNATGLPYWSELALNNLPAGRYVLQVLATDRIGNHSVSQQINFSVE
ncbi:MAG: hypothetical protein QOD75_3720 [Blastocatellia bacterium]|jgi:VWFA-related protein|nr:hypothetical protein [Blastocatellia bacterium]